MSTALESLESRRLLSAIPQPVIPHRSYSITTYGGAKTSSSDNSAAIQKTIDKAAKAGGGTVLVPAGLFLSGPIELQSHINLQLAKGASLRMISKDKFPDDAVNFILAKHINNVEVSGQGTIDGQGASWWPDEDDPRPALLRFDTCDTVLVKGVTFKNAAKFNMPFGHTNNVTIDGVTISAPEDSPNTDGIDPAGSNYLIRNCKISVGDDDIAVKPQNVACRNITITGCTIGTGHGISVGGQTNRGLSGMVVSNTTFSGTDNGLRLKAGRGLGGLVQNIRYTNIRMVDVDKPIYVTSYYLSGGDKSPSDPSTDAGEPRNALTPVWRNISFTNITVRGAKSNGIILYGLPEAPIRNVTFSNVHVVSPKGAKLYHAQLVKFVNSKITVSSGEKLLTFDATETGL